MDARTAFERERDKLVAEISEVSVAPQSLSPRHPSLQTVLKSLGLGVVQSLGRLLTNVNALNRNIEAANLVGKQFDHPHTLWSKCVPSPLLLHHRDKKLKLLLLTTMMVVGSTL